MKNLLIQWEPKKKSEFIRLMKNSKILIKKKKLRAKLILDSMFFYIENNSFFNSKQVGGKAK